jgi:N-acetylglucosamine-6-phosphate deacetylase
MSTEVIYVKKGWILRRGQLQQEDLWFSDGKIIAPQKAADEIVDARGCLIAPGLIDIQINGCYGCDFTSDPTSIVRAAYHLPRHGVTAFLPTLISTEPDTYSLARSILGNLATDIKGAQILGLHAEGPFLNPQCAGAHEVHHIVSTMDSSLIHSCYGSTEGIKMVTLAPELPGALASIQQLNAQGILVAAGHSQATWDQMQEGLARGVRLVTHLFNAMRPFHHREPGLIGAALCDPSCAYTIIADGHHVHPTALKMAWKCHPEGLILISDGMAALGLGTGSYVFGQQQVVVRKGMARLEGTDILAGSVCALDEAVRYFYQVTRCSPIEALEAASTKPAQLLGLEGIKGTLEIGADADFIFLDRDLNVVKTYIRGKNSSILN